MTTFKVFSLFILFGLCHLPALGQYTLSGRVRSTSTGTPVPRAEIYNRTTGDIAITDEAGFFRLEQLSSGTHELIIFSFAHEVLDLKVVVSSDKSIHIPLAPLAEDLSEVVLVARDHKIAALRKMRKVEGTAIYAGKKNEVVILEGITGNLAANNARQIFSRVVGLNIYENGDAGLQLNIGGRGLNPNRTQNFNTRQNGYDISADVLGYPESYYTPPAEALKEIQVIRGAASLQYGTQFGGLINFKLKEPHPQKKLEWVSRQSVGSYGLLTSFNSLSGTSGKFSYYTFGHFKKGNGFRENSDFCSGNVFFHAGYAVNDQTKIELEYTWLDYLVQQPGGLTDEQFYTNPDFSNRARNWFKVNWNLFALKLELDLSEQTDLSLNLFGLNASRKAVGYRVNRISQVDDPEIPRELLVDYFNNWGAEARMLTKYTLFNEESVLLLGSKYYTANNEQRQGAGSDGKAPDFNFAEDEFPYYPRQSAFRFPNQNLAVFGENIFQVTEKFSVTPGFRAEYIHTKSAGAYKSIFRDRAGNVLKSETLSDHRDFERSFVLLGIGSSYALKSGLELYGNFSQNYRSVTFNDIRVINPVLQVDPNIQDEEGYTADIGIRGKSLPSLNLDVSIFALQYKDRIGEVLKPEVRENASGDMEATGRIIRYRGNIGDAFIYGLETFASWDLRRSFWRHNKKLRLGIFLNTAFTDSQYLRSEQNNVVGNQVEFIPAVNLKTGLNFGHGNLLGSLQYSYLSRQFTDATNAPQDKNDSQRGIEGAIPAYSILDLSLSYSFGRFKIESGINNLLNTSYFTRRATGYPGPGIIPAQPLTWYTTLEFKI